nr:hypothetical protein [Pseudoxanthomonas sp.]
MFRKHLPRPRWLVLAALAPLILTSCDALYSRRIFVRDTAASPASVAAAVADFTDNGPGTCRKKEDLPLSCFISNNGNGYFEILQLEGGTEVCYFATVGAGGPSRANRRATDQLEAKLAESFGMMAVTVSEPTPSQCARQPAGRSIPPAQAAQDRTLENSPGPAVQDR